MFDVCYGLQACGWHRAQKVEQDMTESGKMMEERGARMLVIALARGDEVQPCPAKCANGKRRAAKRWVTCRRCTGTGLITRPRAS